MTYKPNEIECGELCKAAINALSRTDFGLRNFPTMMRKIIELRAWERRDVGGGIVELSSLRELITLPPIQGWGEDITKVEAILRDENSVYLMFKEELKHQGERADFCNNVTEVKAITGNSKAYSLKQVVEKCDKEVAAEVLAGKLSPNKALVQAGLRENRQVYMPKDPEQAVEKLRRQFGIEYVKQLAAYASELKQ